MRANLKAIWAAILMLVICLVVPSSFVFAQTPPSAVPGPAPVVANQSASGLLPAPSTPPLWEGGTGGMPKGVKCTAGTTPLIAPTGSSGSAIMADAEVKIAKSAEDWDGDRICDIAADTAGKCKAFVAIDAATATALPGAADNCPKVANRDQKDSDGDGIGNACDTDGAGAMNSKRSAGYSWSYAKQNKLDAARAQAVLASDSDGSWFLTVPTLASRAAVWCLSAEQIAELGGQAQIAVAQAKAIEADTSHGDMVSAMAEISAMTKRHGSFGAALLAMQPADLDELKLQMGALAIAVQERAGVDVAPGAMYMSSKGNGSFLGTLRVDFPTAKSGWTLSGLGGMGSDSSGRFSWLVQAQLTKRIAEASRFGLQLSSYAPTETAAPGTSDYTPNAGIVFHQGIGPVDLDLSAGAGPRLTGSGHPVFGYVVGGGLSLRLFR